MSEQTWWFLARSTGIVAFAAVTAAVIVGLLISTRVAGNRPRPAWSLDLHRMLGGIALVMVVLHLLGLFLDSYVEFGVVDLLVPLASDWKPIAVAAGILGLYLLTAVQLSSLAMKRLPRKLWRVVHYAGFAAFWLAAVHGASAGTDAAHPAYVGGSIAAIVLVLFLTVYRALRPRWLLKRQRAARASHARPSEAR